MENYESEYLLGLKYFQDNDVHSAIKHWENAAEINPKSAKIFSILGNAYKILNEIDTSFQYIEKAANLEPENFNYLYNLGLVFYENKRYKESIQILEKARLVDKTNHELLNDLGVVYFKTNDYENAEIRIRQAMSLAEDYYVAKINLATVLLSAKKLVEAGLFLSELEKIYGIDANIKELKTQLKLISNNADIPNTSIHIELSNQIYEIDPFNIISNIGKDDIKGIDISVVIPIMNERKNLPILYEKLVNVLGDLDQRYEIIFIDDGSRDGSTEYLRNLSLSETNVVLIQFRRNYGQTAALSAGFKYANGHIIVTMDGDLQNDPADIPKLLEKMAEGYDLVNGWRKDRQDKAISRRLPSAVANKIINYLISGTGIQLNDFGCTLKAYKKEIVKNIQLYGEMHRFIPVFAAWLGVKVAEIPVNHHPRIHGKAKYNLSRVSRVLFDFLVIRFFSDYMTRPIQFFGKIVKKIFLWGTALFISLSIASIFTTLSFNTLIILYAIMLTLCTQVLFIGLIGELVIRVYFEVQNKDYYIVEAIHSRTQGK
ncbi:MAG: glycosyltransferase [Candidatus Cloacimonadales bacterium]|jgi:glycosyltransferase involved in cell wall biosynthesis/Tfp pilus assembly protein PilF|nr:glycosyltransferase [Candidatus Cloacimonadota bacterium]MDX9976929.1 glycosyltransferase [Candidatus Cloacimonadales bacterium]